jgi:hypothetical protein
VLPGGLAFSGPLLLVDVVSRTDGLRLVVNGVTDLHPGDATGPPTNSGSMVVGFGTPGPEAASPPHVGPALRWFQPVTDAIAMAATGLDRWGGSLAVSAEVQQYSDGAIETAEGPVALDDRDDVVGRLGPGGTLRWIRKVTTPTPSLDTPAIVDLAVDPSGGVFVTGAQRGDLMFTGPGGAPARIYREPDGAHPSSWPGFVARYDSRGRLAWSRILRAAVTGQNADAAGLQVDALPDGGVLVAVSASGRIRYGPRPGDVIGQPANVDRDLLIRYDRNGIPVWARSDRGDAWWLDADPQGRAVEVGTVRADLRVGQDTLQVAPGGRGLYLARRDRAGRRTSGVLLARGEYGPHEPWLIDRLRVDAAGRAWVVVDLRNDSVELAPDQDGPPIEAPTGLTLLQVGRDGRVRWALPLSARSSGVTGMAPHPDGGMLLTLNASGPTEVGDHTVELGATDVLFLHVTDDGTATSASDGNSGAEWIDAAVVVDGDVVAAAVPRVAHFGANTDTEVHVHEELYGRLSFFRYDDPVG